MPIYEYICIDCKKKHEMIVRVRDNPSCPVCSGDMKKLISKSTFALKGSGWFASGYDKTPLKATDEVDV